MLSSWVEFSADRRTPVKQYAPDLSMRGHKNDLEFKVAFSKSDSVQWTV